MSVNTNVAAKQWAKTVTSIQKNMYWVLGLIIVGFTAYFYYSGLDRPVAGVLWFLGGFLIVYYYWIKWFVIKSPLDPDFDPSGTGACPDYLSSVPNNTVDPATGKLLYEPSGPNDRSYYCVDYVGVSRNGALKKMDPTQLSKYIKDPSYSFKMSAINVSDPQAVRSFTDRLTNYGLSYNSLGNSSLPTHGNMSGGGLNSAPPPGPGTGAPGGLLGAAASSAAGVNAVTTITNGQVPLTTSLSNPTPGGLPALPGISGTTMAPASTSAPTTMTTGGGMGGGGVAGFTPGGGAPGGSVTSFMPGGTMSR
jgi:hypothetical protein